MKELRCTIEDVLSWDLWDIYGECEECKIRELFDDEKYLTAQQILDRTIPIDERFFIVLRPELVPESTLRIFAYWCAEWISDQVSKAGQVSELCVRTAAAVAGYAALDSARSAALLTSKDGAWCAARIRGNGADEQAANEVFLRKLKQMLTTSES